MLTLLNLKWTANLFFNVKLTELKEVGSTVYTAFNDFFNNNSGFLIGFLIAIAGALVVAAIFYLIIGRASYKMSKLLTWIVFLAITGIGVFLINNTIAKKGVRAELTNQININNNDEDEPDEEIAELLYDWMKKVENGTDNYVRNFAFMSFIYSVVFFIVFSLMLKRFSIYAKAIPFGIKDKNLRIQ